MKAFFVVCFAFILGTGWSQDLSVMTYNIRLDHAGDGVNRWDMRKANMVAQLGFYEPDIFGIQEGLPHQVKYLDSALADYAYVGVGRDDGAEKGEFSAIYYQAEQFNLLQSGTFWLSTTPEKPSVGWDAALPRVCTYGLFEKKSDGQKFWVFNTHFDHIGVDARVNSMKLILDQMERFNEQKLPAVLMGDLNVEPTEGPILEMTSKLADTRAVAKLTFGPDATFNGFKFEETPQKRIDYIAINEQFDALKYAVLTDSNDQKYISDHFAVYCELAFK